MRKILILGGGFGGIFTVKNLFKYFKNDFNTEIILIDSRNYFLFTPLLGEAATGGVSLRDIIEPIREIFNYKNFKFIHSKILEIDLDNKILECGEINYDYLVISLSSVPNFYDIVGAEKYAFTLKSIDDANKLKKHLINIFERASFLIEKNNNLNSLLNFVIVGGGPTGVELAAEIHNLFFNTFKKMYPLDLIKNVNIFIIEKNNELVSNFNPILRKKVFQRIFDLGIKVLLNKSIKEVSKEFIVLDDNQKILTQTVIWTAGVRPADVRIIGKINFKNNRILVNEFLQINNYPEVFAIGDYAYIQNKDGVAVPQLAQAAVAEAKIVALNIKNLILKNNLIKFEFKLKGYLIPLGKLFAVGEIHNLIVSGILAWILWRLVYVSKIILLRNKIKTLIDWIVDLFLPRNTSEI
ncbi:MAG: NAD(P)/FAD-dependent oxidoreductase [Patescibacteria group bacterium]|nr:NAD(P)/FAD-dependent oxidoreductase [Patescibacteria group bacterium]